MLGKHNYGTYIKEVVKYIITVDASSTESSSVLHAKATWFALENVHPNGKRKNKTCQKIRHKIRHKMRHILRHKMSSHTS